METSSWCHSCGLEITGNWKCCPKCGEELARAECGKCGDDKSPDDAQFCVECGVEFATLVDDEKCIREREERERACKQEAARWKANDA